jgi:hypothetical protein
MMPSEISVEQMVNAAERNADCFQTKKNKEADVIKQHAAKAMPVKGVLNQYFAARRR